MRKKPVRKKMEPQIAGAKQALRDELARAERTLEKNVAHATPKLGRPTDYRPEYCDALREHMRQGNSFESFGAEVRCGKRTLYLWAEAHEDFMQATQEGRQLCAKFYEGLGKMMASGQLRRIVKEEPVLDAQHQPVLDPKTGQVLKRYEYAPAQGNAAAWIFLTKNLIGWRDKRDIAFEGVPGGQPIQIQSVESMTDEELKAELKVLARKVLEDE